MIKNVLITSVIVFIIGLIIFWFLTGGVAAAKRTASTLSNPIGLIFGENGLGSFIRLPWQSATSTRGPDISEYATQADEYNRASEDESVPAETPTPASQARSFGNPSPYIGKVVFSGDEATEANPAAEYVQLEASGNNSSPVGLAGWSLQSAVSGTRMYIPQAAPVFIMGIVNNVQGVVLEPGAQAIITTGASPVGTSFRENMCSGYLGELQTFTPELSGDCPSPAEVLPMNADNLRTYGGSCFDYLNSLSQCHFPASLPADLSSACRTFVANTMSYNGCTNAYRNKPAFGLPSWRLYIALRTELWANSHDVIRLLDAEGRTVDVLTY